MVSRVAKTNAYTKHLVHLFMITAASFYLKFCYVFVAGGLSLKTQFKDSEFQNPWGQNLANKQLQYTYCQISQEVNILQNI